MQLLCRNYTRDFATWKQHFDADAEDQRAAGLTLLQMWRDHDDPSRVFFLFDVNVEEKARAFLDNPRARQQADKSGVTDADYYFLDTA